MAHLVTAVLEVTTNHVERRERHAMANMGAGIRRDTANVHPDFARLDGAQRFLAPGLGVVHADIHVPRSGFVPRLLRGQWAPSSWVRNSGLVGLPAGRKRLAVGLVVLHLLHARL